jgi:hypothetical protein
VPTRSDTERPEASTRALSAAMSAASISGWSDGGDGVLPDQVLGGHLGAEIERLGPHVAVGELEPGAGEGVGEELGVRVVAARDRP